jgi:hypothetical protein
MSENITNLLLSTILMLNKSIIKDYLFKLMMNLNKLNVQNHFEHSGNYNLNDDMIEDINIILDNMDSWIRLYNSEMRMLMKRELFNNLKKLTVYLEKLKMNVL